MMYESRWGFPQCSCSGSVELKWVLSTPPEVPAKGFNMYYVPIHSVNVNNDMLFLVHILVIIQSSMDRVAWQFE